MGVFDVEIKKLGLIRSEERANDIIEDTLIKLDDPTLTDEQMEKLVMGFIRAKYSAHMLACKKYNCRFSGYEYYAKDMRAWTFNELCTCDRINAMYDTCVTKLMKSVGLGCEAYKTANETSIRRKNAARAKAKEKAQADKTGKFTRYTPADDNMTSIMESLGQSVHTKEKAETEKQEKSEETIIAVELVDSPSTQQGLARVAKVAADVEKELMSDAEYVELYEKCKAMGYVK